MHSIETSGMSDLEARHLILIFTGKKKRRHALQADFDEYEIEPPNGNYNQGKK